METVDLEGFSIYDFHLVLDNAGNLHVGYQNYTGNVDLSYAYEDGSGWHTEIADAYGEGGSHVSLALDACGYPHLSHIASPDLPYPPLRYAYKDAEGWHAETVEFVPAMFTSLGVDSKGRPHIAYFDVSNADLRYALKETNGWHLETVDADGYTGRYPSLKIDSNDRVHISYHDHSNEDLRYVYQQGAVSIILTWQLVGNELQLSWTEVIGANYWVYGASNQAYFPPGFSPGYEHRIAVLPPGTLTWSTTNGIGDPENNWAFIVLAVNDSEQELGRSNRVGEYDASLPMP